MCTTQPAVISSRRWTIVGPNGPEGYLRRGASVADCALCTRPQPADTAWVCTSCTGLAVRSLDTVADLWADLQDVVVGLTRYGDPTPRAGRPAPAEPVRPGLGRPEDDHRLGWPGGLPVRLGAADVADATRNTLTTWARHVAEARGGDHPPVGTVELARWLVGQAEWLRHRREGVEALEELADVGPLVRRTVDRPAPRVDAGECGAVTEAGTCRQRLSASPGAARVHCPGCGAVWAAQERREALLAAARDLRGTAEEISTWLSILVAYTPAATVRSWIHRKRLVGTGGWYPFAVALKLRQAQPREKVRI